MEVREVGLTACGHELQISFLDGAFVACEIFVVDGT